ncbi:MAG: hypothetical protein CMN85_12445 [Spongiibacteraceae bacterium]|mgnify:CR=1 FL=1|nr:hypothetical protein [Spongiibacteraceae bacterium]
MALALTNISGLPDAHVQGWAASASGGDRLALVFDLPRYWQKTPATDRLVAVYEKQPNAALHFIVCEASSLADNDLNGTATLSELAGQLGCEIFGSDLALALQPVHIPKPWGEEIWYTGMEDRGVALAGHADRAVPLPWALSALPSALCGHRERDLMLLKILAPRPEEVYGDLYFELHEEKREVYVVTSVDPKAWPDGVGAIRFGFDPVRRCEYANDADFRAAFRQAVVNYEAVRREIDGLLDERVGDSIAARESALSSLPQTLTERERELRAEMNAFTALLPLRSGDVVKVPTHTPHALQHGVRTIEFQTPVYERLIVAFAQKVLTQSHWDTEAAVAKMQLDTPEQPPSECLRDSGGVRVERIVDFADFEVQRYIVQPGSAFELPGPEQYGVFIGIQGQLPIGPCGLGPEQALLLPNSHPALKVEYQPEAGVGEALIFLAGYPAEKSG